MRRFLIVGAAALGLHACGGASDAERAEPADTLTRAQRDSVIAEMPIPGAHGVGAARQAAERAGARAQQHDTIR